MKKIISSLFAILALALIFTSCKNGSTPENYDFVYEIVNNTSGTLTVSNYIIDYSTSTNGQIIATFDEVVIKKGQTYDFFYNLAEFRQTYGTNKTYLGAYFYPEGKWKCSGWENDLNQTGKIHTVTATDADANYCMNGVNSWSILKGYEFSTVETDFDFIYEVVNNTSGSLTVSNYLRKIISDTNYEFLAYTNDVVIAQGGTYQFKYNLDELKEKYGSDNVYIGAYFYPEGKWKCSGWENDLNQTGKKHTVTATDADANYCMNGENSWSNL